MTGNNNENRPPRILDWPNEISIGEVTEYYNANRGMVISVILEYGRPGDVLNNYTIGSDIEVIP